MINDITILITTCNRPGAFFNCLESIRKYYPTIEVVVADCSEFAMEGFEQPNTKFVRTPPMCGVSKNRNLALEHIKTKYTVLVEDDFVFLPTSRLEVLKAMSERYGVQVVGGPLTTTGSDGNLAHDILEGTWDVEQKTNTLKLSRKSHQTFNDGFSLVDFTSNFFLFDTQAIRLAGGWRDELHIQEHFEFFVRMKNKGIKVGYVQFCDVYHKHVNHFNYDKYRNNEQLKQHCEKFSWQCMGVSGVDYQSILENNEA